MLAAARVEAEELPLELVWEAPAECPSSAEVHAELQRVVKVQPRLGLARLVARVEVTRKGAGYVARVTTEHDGRRGERSLSAADCALMVRSVSLVLGLAFGEGSEIAGEESSTSRPMTPPSPASPSATTQEASTPAPASPSASTRPEVGVWIAGGVGFALLTSAAFAGEAGVDLRFSRVSLGLRGFGWPGVNQTSADLAASYAAFGGGARGCGLAPLGSLVFAGCGAFAVAAVRGAADASETVRADSATAPWYAVSAAISLDWPRGSWLQLRATGELFVSLNRPRFKIEDGRTTHRVSAFVPLLAAGVVLVL
jgi:hypothetical protein